MTTKPDLDMPTLEGQTSPDTEPQQHDLGGENDQLQSGDLLARVLNVLERLEQRLQEPESGQVSAKTSSIHAHTAMSHLDESPAISTLYLDRYRPSPHVLMPGQLDDLSLSSNTAESPQADNNISQVSRPISLLHGYARGVESTSAAEARKRKAVLSEGYSQICFLQRHQLLRSPPSGPDQDETEHRVDHSKLAHQRFAGDWHRIVDARFKREQISGGGQGRVTATLKTSKHDARVPGESNLLWL